MFTPTEAGGIGGIGAIVIALVSRRFTAKKLSESVWDTVQVTGSIIILLLGAYVFSRFLNISNLPEVMSDFISNLEISRYGVLAMIVVLYLVIGMFMDVLSAIVVTVPVIFPAVTALGFDPIWFGVVMVILLEAGLVTPPVGLNVFVLGSITDTPMSTIFKGVWPFVAVMLLCIVIITIFPQIALFLPSGM
jgi:tripartite ATP-independent transporter DctM subunit